MEATHAISTSVQVVRNRVAEYSQLIKVRLSSLVVFSAAMAYLWSMPGSVNVATILLVCIGGFLITGAANTLNQVIEKDSDKLMERTFERPLADERLTIKEALIFAIVIGVTGLMLLYFINPVCTILGALAITIYAAVYTPLKKISRITVIPGAIAGSIPVVIGSIAAAGKLTPEAVILFSVQFVWQFPHTWSIAWLLDDEYKKAGIKMMPDKGGRNAISSIMILASTLLTIPLGLIFYYIGWINMPASICLTLAGLGFSFSAVRLYKLRTVKSALGVMFGSFAYLPFVQVALVIIKIIAK